MENGKGFAVKVFFVKVKLIEKLAVFGSYPNSRLMCPPERIAGIRASGNTKAFWYLGVASLRALPPSGSRHSDDM
jgi:hypothetical protein